MKGMVMMNNSISMDELLAVTRAIRPGFSKKTLDSWVASGLVARPKRGAGRKMYVPAGQRYLVELMSQARRVDGKKMLDWQRARMVLFAYLGYGEEVVPIPQVTRAWATFIRGALLPPRSAKGKTLTEALDSCERVPAMWRLRTTADYLAHRWALDPDDRRHISKALFEVMDVQPGGEDALKDALKHAWRNANPARRETTARGISKVLSYQMAALAHADAIDDAYWRWVRPLWMDSITNYRPYASLLPECTSLDDMVNHIWHHLLTLFGMAMLIPADGWVGCPDELRPRGLYRPAITD